MEIAFSVVDLLIDRLSDRRYPYCLKKWECCAGTGEYEYNEPMSHHSRAPGHHERNREAFEKHFSIWNHCEWYGRRRMTGPQPQPMATESEAGRLAVRWDTAENNLGPDRHIYIQDLSPYIETY
jgi:hypothetical protein